MRLISAAPMRSVENSGLADAYHRDYSASHINANKDFNSSIMGDNVHLEIFPRSEETFSFVLMTLNFTFLFFFLKAKPLFPFVCTGSARV